MRVYTFEGGACAALPGEPPVGMPEGMPFLLDDDGVPIRVVNHWLRSLPTTGAPAPKTWVAYASDLKAWVGFLQKRALDVIDDPSALKEAVATYYCDRRTGPLARRLDDSSWCRAISSISSFYEWAESEGLIDGPPFSYRLQAIRGRDGASHVVRRNLAATRRGKRHVSVRWLEQDFLDLFVEVGLAGMLPDGGDDPAFRGREPARNAAVGDLAAASGLRAQEFSSLLVWELPPPPSDEPPVVPLAVPGVIAKGGKSRSTWVSPRALRRVDSYFKLERPLSLAGCRWRPAGDALEVSEPDRFGGRVNGRRLRWDRLSLGDRRRLVAPDGGPAMWALTARGAPVEDWEHVFRAASARCQRFSPGSRWSLRICCATASRCTRCDG